MGRRLESGLVTVIYLSQMTFFFVLDDGCDVYGNVSERRPHRNLDLPTRVHHDVPAM